MQLITKLETALDELLNKKAPVAIPTLARRTIARALWWVVLIVGVLQLWAAISLWQWGHIAERLHSIPTYYMDEAYVRQLGPLYYLSLATMAIVAILVLVSSTQLKDMRLQGWKVLYYALIIEAFSALLQLCTGGGGISSFLGAALSTVIGAYVLFQIRDYFGKADSAEPSTRPTAPTHKKSNI